jgi:hypothetical protein
MDATKTKPFNIDKKLVYDAYKAVKANAGAAGALAKTRVRLKNCRKRLVAQFRRRHMPNLPRFSNRQLRIGDPSDSVGPC